MQKSRLAMVFASLLHKVWISMKIQTSIRSVLWKIRHIYDKYCEFGNFHDTFIFANSVKGHICDIKICIYVLIYLHQ